MVFKLIGYADFWGLYRGKVRKAAAKHVRRHVKYTRVKVTPYIGPYLLYKTTRDMWHFRLSVA